MASASVAPPKPPSRLPPEPHGDVVDKRIRQTRRQLKLNDFATASIALLAGVLGYLLVGAIADHWLVPGGLGFKSRLVLFLGLVGGAGWYCVGVLLPPLVYQVNPIYAAKTLEQARPSLKNSLINLLLLRREGTTGRENPLAERVIEGLRDTTADQLNLIPAEVAVDRIHLIRRGYVLVGLVALAALYLIFSPKNPMPSFGRVLWPWARIAAPSRVEISQLRPGNATVFQGRSATASAVVEGLRSGEEVLLRYSTDDGQIVDQAIPMTPGEGHNRFECQVPPTKAGLQQSLDYYVTAGDCTTFRYRLEMEVPPTIVVDSVRYTYPPYTGLPERVVNDSADVRAIEGTQIGLEATANRQIQWAGIEISGQAEGRIRMRTEGKKARGQFKLQLGQDDEGSPHWYQIRFAESETGQGRENLDPVRHRIEVFADRAPDVRWVDAPAENATVPLDGMVELNIEASDPDFALSRVAILAQRDGRPLPIPLLLDRTDTGRGYEGQFKSTYQFEPAGLGLRVGDEVQYQAVAEDNKQPQRNRAETEPRSLKIGPPERSEPQNSKAPGQSGSSEPPQTQPQPGEKSQDSSQPGEKAPAQDPATEAEQNDPNQPAEAGEQNAPSQQEPGDKGEGESGESSNQPGDNPQDNPGGQSKQPGESGSAPDNKTPQAQDDEGQKDDRANQEGQKGGNAGQEGQKGGQSGQEGSKRQQPVAPEAPGDVFEEVLKQREKEMQEGGQPPQEGGQQGEKSQPKPDEPKPGQGEPSGDPQAGDKSEGAEEHPGQSDVPPNRMEQGGKEGEEESPKPPEDMAGEGGQSGTASASESPNQSPETESNTSGGGKPAGKPGKGDASEEAETVDGGKAKPEDLENGKVESVERQPHDPATGSQPEQSAKPQPGSPDPGDPTGSKPAQEPANAEPSPMPKEANQPNAKKPTGSQPADPQMKSEAQSPSFSKKQSEQDQRDPIDGDESGNGGKGGGQDSDQQGLGNPGSSTPDHEGGQPGGEQGEGETGPEAGDKVPTDQSTGNQARQPGGKGQAEGESQGDSDNTGQKPQQDSQMPPSQQPPAEQPSEQAGGSLGSDPNQRGSTEPRSQAAGGSGVGTATGEGTSEALGAEAANKEYAEKATNLALEYIEDQLKNSEPNQELLDRLQWTRQDLEQFLRHWQKMKADAKDTGPAGQEARRELDDALKSLGLRPARSSVQGGRVKDDTFLKSESIRSTPPPAWRELTQEYTKSISSGER